MVEIKKLPPGEAIGARDLQNWAMNRTVGRAGSYDRKEEKILKKRDKQQKRFRGGRQLSELGALIKSQREDDR